MRGQGAVISVENSGYKPWEEKQIYTFFISFSVDPCLKYEYHKYNQRERRCHRGRRFGINHVGLGTWIPQSFTLRQLAFKVSPNGILN